MISSAKFVNTILNLSKNFNPTTHDLLTQEFYDEATVGVVLTTNRVELMITTLTKEGPRDYHRFEGEFNEWTDSTYEELSQRPAVDVNVHFPMNTVHFSWWVEHSSNEGRDHIRVFANHHATGLIVRHNDWVAGVCEDMGVKWDPEDAQRVDAVHDFFKKATVEDTPMIDLRNIGDFANTLRLFIEGCFTTETTLKEGERIYPNGLSDVFDKTDAIVVTASPDRALVTVHGDGLWDTREYKKINRFCKWNRLITEHLTPVESHTPPVTTVKFYKDSDGEWNFTATMFGEPAELDKIHHNSAQDVLANLRLVDGGQPERRTLREISELIRQSNSPNLEDFSHLRQLRTGNLGLREMAFSDAKAPFGGIGEFVTPRDASDNPDGGDEELSIQQDLYELQSTLDVFANKHLPGGLKHGKIDHFDLDYDEGGLTLRITNTDGVVTEFTKLDPH